MEDVPNNCNPLEDLSTRLVKETLVKVLSNQEISLENMPDITGCDITVGCDIENFKETEQFLENNINNEISTLSIGDANKNKDLFIIDDIGIVPDPISIEELYSSSSTHLCQKLSETLHSATVIDVDSSSSDVDKAVRYLLL